MGFGGAALVVAVMTATADAPRQEPRQEPDSIITNVPPWLERARTRLEALEDKGFKPSIGTIVSGSGFAIGAEVTQARFGRSLFGAGVEGQISVRDYREGAVRLGYLIHRRASVELRAADAPLYEPFTVERHGSGFAAYVEHRYRVSPASSLYGVDETGALTRTDYSVSGTTSDLVFQQQIGAKLGVGARIGVLSFDLSAGDDEERPNAHDVFAVHVRESGLDRARYLTVGLGTVLDTRNRIGPPASGQYVAGAVWWYRSRTDQQPSFVRYTVDARHFQSLARRHVVVARVLGSFDAGRPEDAAPFYLLTSLGGGHSMRGYPTYRLRGGRLVGTSLEYRWHAWKYVELAPFVDGGRVWRAPLPGTPDSWLVTPGFAIRFRTDRRVLVRAEVARSVEGVRYMIGIGTPF
jgi:hypothetical protein